jgi:hypothetical protein
MQCIAATMHTAQNLRVHPHACERRPWLHARVRGELSSATSSYTLVLVRVLN